MRKALPVAIPLVLLVALGSAIWLSSAPDVRPERAIDPREAATYGDLELMSDSGPLRLSDLKGKVVVVYFGYTSCPDFCPTTFATLGRAFDLLSDSEQDRATALFVSVDPERDSPERLGEYVRYFWPTFRAGTAEPEAIRRMAHDWGVLYRKAESGGSAMAYVVDHSTQSFLVGPDGRFREELPHGTTPKVVAERIRAAMTE